MRYEHAARLLPPDAVELVKRALHKTDEMYSAGPAYISATSIVGEPLYRQLMKRHGDDLTADVMEGTWALFGSALHRVLELAEGEDDLHERRFFSWFPTWPDAPTECCGAPAQDDETKSVLLCTKCKRPCSWVVSGQADLLTGSGVLYDFKCTSSWAFRLEDGEVKSEWEGQLNVLAWLIRSKHWYYPDPSKAHEPQSAVLEREGREVSTARIFAFLRDFSPGQAERNTEECRRTGNEPDYPLSPMFVVEAPLWSMEEAEAFLRQRLALHSRYDGVQTQKIPECSKGMRWHKGDSWAVFKHTVKGDKPARATKVFYEEKNQSEKDAWKFADDLKNEGKQVTVETRPGESTKCAHYCSARSVCPYGRSRAVENRIAAHAKEREASGFKVQRW